MKFTENQRKRIDILLAEGEEEQRRNGNILYTHEEIGKMLGFIQKEKQYRNSIS